MQIGLARGADVERLQRVLEAQGHAIDAGERERGGFGPSTVAAHQAFQAEHKLAETLAVDAATLEILFQVEQNIAPAPPVAVDPGRGIVTGKPVDEDGKPVGRTAVALVAKQLRTETALGTVTDDAGQYQISYARKSALNLLARATDATGKVIASSATVYAAPARVEIDLTTAANGVLRAIAIHDASENRDGCSQWRTAPAERPRKRTCSA